ncbi:GerAB/ArcD/ProY family transporter [Clostridium akagii]|uniref:GerAB/ArcD/ProY family transporter n=1 Tax=Clostridium akagii TaxID=91623 RepID=UPI00047EDF54|nr:endospore germination permease [Clostridium akagii]
MDKFNGGHLFFILSGVTIVSMKTYPTIYTSIGGKDSWISVICSGLLIFAFAYIIITISKNNNNFNIYDIYCTALGKTLGKIFLWLFALTLVLTLIECSSVEANSMHINVLIETPPWFFIVFFIFPALYTVTRGKNAVIIVTIIGICFVIFSGTNLAILTQNYKHFEYILPIMSNGITLKFVGCIIKSLAYFANFAIILPMLTEIANKKTMRKNICWSLIFIIQMEVVATLGVITTFGAARLNNIYYPKLIQTQLINYFGFLESGELYVLLQMIGGWYIKYILTFLALSFLLEKLGVKSKLNIFIITIIVGISAYLCSFNTFILFQLLNIFLDVILLNFVIIPIIVFIIYNAKNKKMKLQTKNDK